MRKRTKVLVGAGICFLIILAGVVFGGYQKISERHKKTVTWIYEGDFVSDKGEKEFNNLLRQKGYDIIVDFQGFWMEDSYFETGEMPDFSDADILSLPVELPYTCHYADMARNGELYDWTAFLESKEGNKLKESMPDLVWESMRVDGSIYGLLNPNVYLQQYIVLNAEMLKKYNLVLSEWSSEDDFFEALHIVWEGEKEKGFPIVNEIFLNYLPDTYMIMYGGYDCMGMHEEDGEWKVDLLINIPEYMELLTQMNRIYQAGMVGYNEEAITQGNFFSYITRTYSNTAALEDIKKLYKGACVVIECTDWDSQVTGSGYKTVIMDASEKLELARELLTAVYTDQELSEFLAYGSGDIPYEVLNGKISTAQNNSSTHGNLFLLRPVLARTDSWSEEIRLVYDRAEKTALCGFYADLRKIQDDWREIVLVQLKHMDFYCGMSEDMKSEEAAIRAELKETGIDTVLELLNEQLQDFVREE